MTNAPELIHVKGTHCLACKHRLDAAQDVYGDQLPSSGDITICLYCGHVMAFADDLSLRELTDEEVREIAGDPRIIAAQRARAGVMTPVAAIAIGKGELEGRPHVRKGDTIRRETDGKRFAVEVSKNAETGEDGSLFCVRDGDQSYLVGIDGKLLSGWELA